MRIRLSYVWSEKIHSSLQSLQKLHHECSNYGDIRTGILFLGEYKAAYYTANDETMKRQYPNVELFDGIERCLPVLLSF